MRNAKKTLVSNFGGGRHASFPPRQSVNDKPVLLRTLVKTKEASNGAEEEGLHVVESFVEFAIWKA